MGGNRVESFKRWLYGTSKTFASGWREEAALPSQAGEAPKDAPKPDKAS